MRLYFDACTLIRVVEGPATSPERFGRIAEGAARFGTAIFTSELSLAEVLVKPLKDQDFKLIVAYNSLLAGQGLIETIPCSREVLGLAARIRNRRSSIKLPDAIHIATAEFANCSDIITGDKRWSGATDTRISDMNDFDVLAFLELFS